MVDESLIGLDLGEISFPLERGKIRELAAAVLEDDPVYTDAGAARKAGFDGIPAPLNFPVVAMHWRAEDDMIAALGLDLRRVLHGEVAWEYLKPVGAGTQLTASRRVADITTREGKRGGTMTLVQVETEFRDGAGDVVTRQVDTLIETNG